MQTAGRLIARLAELRQNIFRKSPEELSIIRLREFNNHVSDTRIRQRTQLSHYFFLRSREL
jgi:hypothetical protein